MTEPKTGRSNICPHQTNAPNLIFASSNFFQVLNARSPAQYYGKDIYLSPFEPLSPLT
ncbi:hypothetical protein BCIN_08g05610 [Botrytis cinerea B05.10]|uniref:Uncharacterized protein n=1 Tax=Botryotinia fuckeliana (strain B05.10) TaxID=332648 RepID=A0A384JQS4_BOTFB|nr:hypothetical protein BCIN_08g05610 [Botrytis cinerea B05.10]ATZ52945.1 hypothetical protein BCIN_08g05610 [Botrytis cinerea B05.10]